MAYSARWSHANMNSKLGSRCTHTIASFVCARSQCRSLLTTANVAVRRNRVAAQLASVSVFSRRALHEEHKESTRSTNLQTNVDNLILKNEFELKNDIRDYLRKWQLQNLNPLDPVYGPGTTNTNTPTTQGNMLNDNVGTMMEDQVQAVEVDDESSSFHADVDDNGVGGDILEPGDLVGFYSAMGNLVPAVYVRSVERQKQFYTVRGKWRVASDREIDLVVKDFVPRQLIDILRPYLPAGAVSQDSILQNLAEGGVPRSAAAPIIAILREVASKERDIYRAHAARMDNMFEHLASAHERRVYTLAQMTANLLEMNEDEVTPEMLFMVHKAALRFPFLITIDRSSIFTDRYLIQPAWFANDLRTVWRWVRVHQQHTSDGSLNKTSNFINHPIQKFLDKAKRLISQSRRIRSPTIMASVGPSAERINPEANEHGINFVKESTEEFDSDDKKILQFLIAFATPPHQIIMGIERYSAIHIMRSTGMFTAVEIERGSIPLLLQELGVFPAWQNIYAMNPFLALPGHNLDTATELSAEAARRVASEPDRYGNDAMADLRVDWGNLPIYCIDDPGALEIDDGISLEPIPGDSDTFWLRVHVANPTAFVPHDDPVAENAAKRLTTVYLPERSYPMIPLDLTKEKFSLAQGRPTLTISAKVNLDGDVLETNVTNGLAQNVIYLTHKKVRSIFDADMEEAKTLTVGGGVYPPRPDNHYKRDLSEADTETFRTLRKIMANIHAKWKENGGLSWPDQFSDKNPFIYPGKVGLPCPTSEPSSEGGYYVGDPIVGVKFNNVDPYHIPDLSQRNLVALVMQFACHTAGRWGAERNIPMVYDGTYFHPEYPPLTPQKLQSFTSGDWRRYAPPKGYSSSSVISHSGLGVDAYTKTTSPLRRFSDLLAHYQIEAALRYEKHHPGEKFDGTNPTAASALPFSLDEVDHILDRMKAQYPLIKHVQNQSNYFWTCQFLFRAFYFGECELPETMPCLVQDMIHRDAPLTTNYQGSYSGRLLPFGLPAQLFVTEEFKKLDHLCTVEAKIVAVNMAQHIIQMEVVRKVKDWERIGDWA